MVDEKQVRVDKFSGATQDPETYANFAKELKRLINIKFANPMESHYIMKMLKRAERADVDFTLEWREKNMPQLMHADNQTRNHN